MEEAQNLGIPQFVSAVQSVRLLKTGVFLDVKKVIQIAPERTQDSVQWGELQMLPLKSFRFAHYRTDPPVDLSYIHPLQILAIGLQKAPTTQVINPIEVLLTRNEKLEG